jgi:hypothetical protein
VIQTNVTDWSSVKLSDTATNAIVRTSNRIVVGLPLCACFIFFFMYWRIIVVFRSKSRMDQTQYTVYDRRHLDGFCAQSLPFVHASVSMQPYTCILVSLCNPLRPQGLSISASHHCRTTVVKRQSCLHQQSQPVAICKEIEGKGHEAAEKPVSLH